MSARMKCCSRSSKQRRPFWVDRASQNLKTGKNAVPLDLRYTIPKLDAFADAHFGLRVGGRGLIVIGFGDIILTRLGLTPFCSLNTEYMDNISQGIPRCLTDNGFENCFYDKKECELILSLLWAHRVTVGHTLMDPCPTGAPRRRPFGPCVTGLARVHERGAHRGLL